MIPALKEAGMASSVRIVLKILQIQFLKRGPQKDVVVTTHRDHLSCFSLDGQEQLQPLPLQLLSQEQNRSLGKSELQVGVIETEYLTRMG